MSCSCYLTPKLSMMNPEAALGYTIGLVDANMPTNLYQDVGYLVNKYIVTPIVGD